MKHQQAILATSTLAAIATTLSSSCTPAPPLRPAVEAHLTAIATRNMDALLPTITRGSDLIMIAPNGAVNTTRQQYVDFHRQWFGAKDDGRLDTQVVHLIQADGLGHALIKSRYRSTDPSGNQRESATWLALTFALEGGAWRLVFDQNTLTQR